MIAHFKKQTESVLAQVGIATANFREIHQIGMLVPLPESTVASVEGLAEQAHDVRSKLGYEVSFYECGAETSTTDALIVAVQATRDLTEKNAPAGRLKLMNFFRRYPEPSRDEQRPLWRYNASLLVTCDKAKNEAEKHLQRAKSLEGSGKKVEALREYQEIYRLYPNAISADKIKLLEEQTR